MVMQKNNKEITRKQIKKKYEEAIQATVLNDYRNISLAMQMCEKGTPEPAPDVHAGGTPGRQKDMYGPMRRNLTRYANKPHFGYIDMEGKLHDQDEFTEDQLVWINRSADEGKPYHFLCYPDIDDFYIHYLYYLAESMPSPKDRILLWKIARCPMSCSRMVDMLFFCAKADLCLPDLIRFKKMDVEDWDVFHDNVCDAMGLPLNTFLYTDYRGEMTNAIRNILIDCIPNHAVMV